MVGEPLFTLYTNAPERFGAARAELAGGWSIRDSPPQVRPLIVDRIV
ncbi:thymidine phosphorylase [Mycobacterium tuberculosis]|uniref:Thymidine phosphorylase n=1 Tax=Mycobacterium tuberculosis TaxID=1773 RepID=A0A654T3X9_MYCTX|nr:thymidine phosphorylase [Mycobacterium tuberculosis]CKR22830.1 thymidine phosphorylase [Mycobacterium tuberculosis]CKT76761.1 thymidine phosphorylase [Mycobacterium tuberculosis]CKU38576.1 thymidine phosphorylase [Mycobacterium tuberculosis]CLY22081.1 thymidine phosphorylase [Mycobacterium tuberculosis]